MNFKCQVGQKNVLNFPVLSQVGLFLQERKQQTFGWNTKLTVYYFPIFVTLSRPSHEASQRRLIGPVNIKTYLRRLIRMSRFDLRRLPSPMIAAYTLQGY